MVAGIFVTLPALFLSPPFCRCASSPTGVQAVARVNPASYVIELGRRLMSIGHDWGQEVRILAVLAVAALVLMAATVAAFRAAAPPKQRSVASRGAGLLVEDRERYARRDG